ncbi:MAG: hypothetical protein ACREQ9_13650 [Candidatus Binatia bacterium]
MRLLAIILGLTATLHAAAAGGEGSGSGPPAGLTTLQIAGRGRAGGGSPNDRFQGRFVIWSVPHDEPPFDVKGPGSFLLRFPVSGTLIAVESPAESGAP